jgi:hypothetical protein
MAIMNIQPVRRGYGPFTRSSRKCLIGSKPAK